MTDEKYIRIGFFEKFRGEDSVLIEADIYGLLEIQSVLLNCNRLVMYMPFSAWYDSGFTRGLLLPFFR
jgi:hypothetical protein